MEENETQKFKPSGIDVNVQGKIPEKYKIGVNGARYYEQMLSILQFMNILLYLYFETYINKNKHYDCVLFNEKNVKKIIGY